MARRTKQLVRNRAKTHKARVKKQRSLRIRRKSRGFHPASTKRKRRADRRMKRNVVAP